MILDSCEVRGSFNRAGDGREGALVEDVINSFAGGLHSLGILEVHLLKRDGVPDVFEVREVSGGEIVDAADFVALFDQSVGEC